jgi:hypothetical protein
MQNILPRGRVLKIAVALCIYAVITYFFLFYESINDSKNETNSTIESVITHSHGVAYYESLSWQRDARSRALYKLWKSYDFPPMQSNEHISSSQAILKDLRLLLMSPRARIDVPVLGCVEVMDGYAAINTAPHASTCFTDKGKSRVCGVVVFVIACVFDVTVLLNEGFAVYFSTVVVLRSLLWRFNSSAVRSLCV